jgi:hypothetical protein
MGKTLSVYVDENENKCSVNDSKALMVVVDNVKGIFIPIPYGDLDKKDFDYYLNKYIYNEDYWADVLTVRRMVYHNAFIEREFIKIPFEIKIGLLKFICIDRNIDFSFLVHELIQRKQCRVCRVLEIEEVLKVCSNDFLNSIFND